MPELTEDEKSEMRVLKSTSLPVIQENIRKGDNASLLGYINLLLNNILFPLNFFNPSSVATESRKRGRDSEEDQIKYSEEDQIKYGELMGILNDVRKKYFIDKTIEEIGPIDLVLFMCGFEPVAVRPGQYEQMKYGTPTDPMLEKTTDDHKMDFIPLQKKGREFLDKLSSFGPFNKHLVDINQNIIPSNQPHRVAMSASKGRTRNIRFRDIIDQLFITPDETEELQFNHPDNSSYMSELKTKRVMTLFGLSEEESTNIWSGRTPRGGRRTSRRKQTKSRNPRKRKSTIQRRRKSVKHSKS